MHVDNFKFQGFWGFGDEPSNILTTTEFANRLVALKDHGVEVEVLDEADLENLGMRALLGVGQGM